MRHPVTVEQLSRLERLDWSEYRAEADLPWGPIQEIGPLRHCRALTALALDGNGIEDLSPLAGCPALEELWLVQNQVTDLSPLRACPKLHTLVLEMNYRLADIAPLRGHPALRYLNLTNTRVGDITPLLELPALRKVSLYGLHLELIPGKADYEVLATLIRRGVEVGCAGISELVAAVRAAQVQQISGDASLLERLQAAGAYKIARLIAAGGINARDEAQEQTPLHWAVKPASDERRGRDPIADRLAVVRLLLSQEGVIVDARDRNGMTPLNWMLLNDATADIEIVRALLDAGAAPDTVSNYDRTPVISALASKREDIADLLIERGRLPLTARIFNQFCEQGMIERVRRAIAEGHDVNAREAWLNRSPLIAAAFAGHGEIARLLLDAGADVRATDAVGETALHKAKDCGTIQLLLDRGAEVDAGSESGRTPLFSLAEYIYPEEARRLIEHGATVTARDRAGNTPLHVCGYAGWKAAASLAMVDLLVDAGADVNALNERQETPLDCCRQPEMRRLIRSRGGRRGETVLKRSR